jgi:aryl-alcohol dehydrogenase-like predicted oxidoreductase
MLPIPGTSSIAHLEENVAAAKLKLTPEEIDSLGKSYRAAWRKYFTRFLSMR